MRETVADVATAVHLQINCVRHEFLDTQRDQSTPKYAAVLIIRYSYPVVTDRHETKLRVVTHISAATKRDVVSTW